MYARVMSLADRVMKVDGHYIAAIRCAKWGERSLMPSEERISHAVPYVRCAESSNASGERCLTSAFRPAIPGENSVIPEVRQFATGG